MDVMLAPRTGLRLKGPVVAASGTFGYGVEFAANNDLSGLGAMVSKGTTLEPRTGNQPLRLIETPAGMLNAIGLQNIGVDEVVRSKATIWATWDTPVLVNVSGTSIHEYVAITSRLDGVPGVSGIELNVSCPNVKEGGIAFGVDPGAAASVTRAVREVTSLPLVVKLTPNVTDIRRIAAAVEEAGADAISLINTVHAMALDVRRRAPTLSTVSGGLSGPAIKPLALHLVYQVAQEVSTPIIGMGGVASAEDAIEFLLAGASAVGMATALLVDPCAWRTVAAGIDVWCRRNRVQDLTELIGAANPLFRSGRKQKDAGELFTAGTG